MEFIPERRGGTVRWYLLDQFFRTAGIETRPTGSSYIVSKFICPKATAALEEKSVVNGVTYHYLLYSYGRNNEFGRSWERPMLRAIKAYAQENGIECYISLEERMACGIGACLGCVCKSREKDEHSNVHNKRVCKDGPVFLASEVEI